MVKKPTFDEEVHLWLADELLTALQTNSDLQREQQLVPLEYTWEHTA